MVTDANVTLQQGCRGRLSPAGVWGVPRLSLFSSLVAAGGENGRETSAVPTPDNCPNDDNCPNCPKKGQGERRVIFHDDRYFPYSAIANVEHDQVDLTMDAENAKLLEWKKRPDYEHHLGDPLQLFYDRGHGVHDPFDDTNPDQT